MKTIDVNDFIKYLLKLKQTCNIKKIVIDKEMYMRILAYYSNMSPADEKYDDLDKSTTMMRLFGIEVKYENRD